MSTSDFQRAPSDATARADQIPQPSIRQLVSWLTSITRPVHAPLYMATALRIINLSLDIALFALASGGLVSVLQSHTDITTLIFWLILISVCKASAYYGEQFLGHFVAFRALELLRTMAFSRLWPLAPGVVFRSRSGDLLTSITRDVDRIEVVYAHTFAPVVSALIVPMGAVIFTATFWGATIAAVPAFCVILALCVVPFLGLSSAFEATRQTLSLRRDLTSHITDSVFGAEEVVGYGRQRDRFTQQAAIEDAITSSSARARRGNAMRRAGNLVLTLISVIGVVSVGLSQSLPLPVVAGLAGGALRLFEGPRGVEDAAGYLDHSLAAARRLWDICHQAPLVDDGVQVLPDGALDVDFDSVSYRYPEAYSDVLHNVSLHVRAGEHVVVMGKSGSGKTTLTNLLMRFDDPTSGQITVGGIALPDLQCDSLRSAVVAVSQRNDLLDASILDNLLLGAPHASENEIWQALEFAAIAEEIRAMPDQLHTAVGPAGAFLSGGQAQRICLARAVLMQPRVLILDEFTAQLNPALEQTIRRRLADLDATIIEISHRQGAIDNADRVIVCDRGVIRQGGLH
ncbi:amino acid ABC transporter ATP-binding/permease protein [Arcanobacterium canis]